MPDDEPKNAQLGLLGAKIKEPSARSQQSWAKKRRIALVLLLPRLGAGFGSLGLGWKAAFEMNLIRFAEKQRIDLSKDDWREKAIYRAAMEHPHLQPGYRPRGRPKRKGKALGLLAKSMEGSKEQQNIIRQVEEIKAIFSDIEKKPMSDSRAAHWYVIYNFLNEFRRKSITMPKLDSVELNTFIDSPDFLDLHAAMKMRISRARRAVTRNSR